MFDRPTIVDPSNKPDRPTVGVPVAASAPNSSNREVFDLSDDKTNSKKKKIDEYFPVIRPRKKKPMISISALDSGLITEEELKGIVSEKVFKSTKGKKQKEKQQQQNEQQCTQVVGFLSL